jgi:hypothetical protein
VLDLSASCGEELRDDESMTFGNAALGAKQAHWWLQPFQAAHKEILATRMAHPRAGDDEAVFTVRPLPMADHESREHLAWLRFGNG